MRDAFFDGGGFAHLRFQAAARAFGFHLERGQFRAQRGQARIGFVAGVLQTLALGFVGGDVLRKRAQLVRRHVEIERRFGGFALEHPEFGGQHQAQFRVHLGFQLAITPGFGGLALQRIELAGDFFQNVEHARQILPRALQFRLRQTLARFEFADAGGFLDDGAAILRARAENLADAPLLDNGVALRAEAGAHEQVLNVAQTGQVAVDQVFAFARAEKAARDGDFGGRGLRAAGLRMCRVGVFVSGGIDQRHGDDGHASGLSVARSGEDHVFHAGAAQTFRRLLAEHPTDGVTQIRLAAPVRTNDGRDAAAIEPKFGAIAKRFETLQLQPL